MPTVNPDTVRVSSDTIPTLSIRPVNIAFNQDIRPKLLDLRLDKGRR